MKKSRVRGSRQVGLVESCGNFWHGAAHPVGAGTKTANGRWVRACLRLPRHFHNQKHGGEGKAFVRLKEKKKKKVQ